MTRQETLYIIFLIIIGEEEDLETHSFKLFVFVSITVFLFKPQSAVSCNMTTNLTYYSGQYYIQCYIIKLIYISI
jgi:hypothetical protein